MTLWKSDVVRRLRREKLPEEMTRRIVDIVKGQSSASLHLAVFTEPYLTHLLSGSKKLESRFSKNTAAPYRQVQPEDIILIKRSSGPVVAVVRVQSVTYQRLRAGDIFVLQRRYSEALCTEPDFWTLKQDAKFVTFMDLTDLTICRPIPVQKKDRRGWVVIKSGNPCLSLE